MTVVIVKRDEEKIGEEKIWEERENDREREKVMSNDDGY